MQLCFGQPVDIEILTLLRSKIDEVSEAVQTWMLKKNQVLKLFCMFPVESVNLYIVFHVGNLIFRSKRGSSLYISGNFKFVGCILR